MESPSLKNKYFSKRQWPYSLFIMNTHFTDHFDIDDERSAILNRKNLFAYCLRTAVALDEESYVNNDKVYKSFAEQIGGLFYTYHREHELDVIAERVLRDLTEEFLAYLTEMQHTHILEKNPAIFKWLPNGVIIRYDDP